MRGDIFSSPVRASLTAYTRLFTPPHTHPHSYYMVQTAAPVRVTVTLTAGSDDSGDSILALGLGGEARQEQNITCPSSGNWASYVPCATSTPLDVPAGVSVLRVIKGRPWLGTVDIALA